MSENHLASGILAKNLRDDLDDLDFFTRELDRMQDDGGPPGEANAAPTDGPKLMLVRPEDPDEASLLGDRAAGHVVETRASIEPASAADHGVDEYGELWMSPGTGRSGDSASASSDFPFDEASLFDNDYSEVQDIRITNPSAVETLPTAEEETERAVPDFFENTTNPGPTPVAKQIAAIGLTGNSPMPARIGVGKLAPAKLNWKPGDPFGCTDEESDRFRWEVMLSTACITALGGMGCIWLLRTILA